MSIGPWVFNSFDLIIIAVIVISMIMAASRGLFRELISIVSLVVAVIFTLFVWGKFRGTVTRYIQPDWVADAVLGVGAFAVSYLIIISILNALTKSLRGRKIGVLDRLTGAMFGVVRGLIVAALGVMIFTADYREAKDMKDYAETLTPEQRAVYDTAPKKVRDMMNPNTEVNLPEMFRDSTFFPLLEKIGDGIRSLPFGRMKTMAERLRDGESVSKVLRN